MRDHYNTLFRLAHCLGQTFVELLLPPPHHIFDEELKATANELEAMEWARLLTVTF